MATQCEVVGTLALESDAEVAPTYEAVVAADAGGQEYVSFEAASEVELVEQVAEIEATVGPVTEIGEQVEMDVLSVAPGDDPRYGSTAQQKVALDHANFDAAWANDEDGSGIVVAVVDTGVRGDHEDLAGNLLPGADFVASTGGTCSDPHTHGTHVAGILGQVDNTLGGIGGAPGVDILPVRVLNQLGSGSSTVVAAGIDWAVAHGADVVNLSLGGPQSAAVTEAIDDAVAAGVTVVAAAGNCGDPNQLSKCVALNGPSFPAALPNVIAVGALTTGENTRASFSNNNTYIDITASGTNVDSTVSTGATTYGTKSGTSMATPFVSAVAALILSGCSMTPADVLATIRASATVTVSGFADPTLELVDAGAAAAAC
ncbi:MAG TPA: S8 family serine peptidase [Acidimicrobiia bacterium]